MLLINFKYDENCKPNSQVIRQGTDITLVGWGAQLAVMEQACIDAEKVSDSY